MSQWYFTGCPYWTERLDSEYQRNMEAQKLFEQLQQTPICMKPWRPDMSFDLDLVDEC
jgi:hypothetical protein